MKNNWKRWLIFSRSIAFLLLDGGKDIGGKSDSTIFGHH